MRGVTRTTVFLCAGMAAIAVMAAPAIAHHASFKSRVTIQEAVPGAEYKGRVFSDLDGCVRHRLVKLFNPDGSYTGFRQFTDSQGRYDILTSPGSDYYAKVPRKVLTPGNHRHVCLPDKSPTV